MNHIAIARNSSRKTHSKSEEVEAPWSGDETPADDLSQVSIISFGTSEIDTQRDSSTKESDRLDKDLNQSRSSSEASRITKSSKKVSKTSPSETESLSRIETQQDIDDLFDDDLKHANILNRIERKWELLTENLNNVLGHLEECGNQVSKASLDCLEVLGGTISDTCDKAEEEMKALYLIIDKCDELTTKLSVAESFRDEVRTLRKSIDTLESLTKQ